jgi:putative phosphoesterase
VKIGIISDIHSNLEALEAVLEALKEENVDRVLCLGDLVGYGPDPNECIHRVMDSSDVVIAGNHDQGAVGLTPLEHFNENARLALEWSRDMIEPHFMETLAALPTIHEENTFLAVHATPNEPTRWHYLFSEAQIVNNLEALTLPLCFVGHSHVPVALILDQDHGIIVQEAGDVRFAQGRKYLINVGSVGQPRDGDPRASCGIYEGDRFRLRRVEYDVAAVQKKMQSSRLPGQLIERLAMGQ